jgi:CheY-like chemotaxis protein
MDPKALIVEDNELLRMLASRTLEEAGFVVFSAPDGPVALRLLEADMFELIIVDFVMPEMWGDEFVRHVRGHRNPAVRLIPVLGLSGSHKDAESRFLSAGANACVRKPLHDEPLVTTVKRLLAANPRRSG